MCNLLSQQLTELSKNIDSRHYNDPDIIEWIYQMEALIISDEQQTISFLRDCDTRHERIIYWLSPLFEDLANEFSSDELIASLKSLVAKYPRDEGLANDVEKAIKIMYRMRDTSENLE